MSLESAFALVLISTLTLGTVPPDPASCVFDKSAAWPRGCNFRGDYAVSMTAGQLSDMKINVAFFAKNLTTLREDGKNNIEIRKLELENDCTCACECLTECQKYEKVSDSPLDKYIKNNGGYMSFPNDRDEAACYVVVAQHLNLSSCCIYVPEKEYTTITINYTSTPAPPSGHKPELIWYSLLAFLTICIILASILCVLCRRKKGDPLPDLPLSPSPSPSNLNPPPSKRMFLFVYKYECELSERLAKELKSILKGLSDWCVTIHDPLSESRQQFLDNNLVLNDYIEESYCIFLIASQPVMDSLDRGKPEQENRNVLERPLRMFVQYFENCQKVQSKTRVVGLEENCPAGLPTRHSSLRFFMLPTKLDSLLEDLSLPHDCCSNIKGRKRLDELAGKAKAKADQQALCQL